MSETIDAFADLACPWCYIGRARLRRVLGERPDLDVTVHWRPFQLQPGLPPEGMPWRAFAERKFGGWERAQTIFDHVTRLGAEEGLTFDFDAMPKAPNTAAAHRLLLWAGDTAGNTAADALADALFRAYFAEGADVTDPAVLAARAEAVGLAGDEAQAVLVGDRYADAVAESQREAQALGVQAVPYYVLSPAHAIPGAQPAEVMRLALDAAFGETAA
jgi:predicted DsbA family dithiol-disulfide isomerase